MEERCFQIIKCSLLEFKQMRTSDIFGFKFLDMQKLKPEGNSLTSHVENHWTPAPLTPSRWAIVRNELKISTTTSLDGPKAMAISTLCSL
jgi:hypothetical protein